MEEGRALRFVSFSKVHKFQPVLKSCSQANVPTGKQDGTEVSSVKAGLTQKQVYQFRMQAVSLLQSHYLKHRVSVHLEIIHKDFSSTIRRLSCQYLISKRKYKFKALCHVRRLHRQRFNKEKESSIFSNILLLTLLPE